MKAQNRHCFLGCPADVILYIIGELKEVRDVVCLQTSCKTLSSIAHERSIWVRLAQQFWQEVWSLNYSTLTLPKTLQEITSLPTALLEALVIREARLARRWTFSSPIRFRLVKEIPIPHPPYEPGESCLLPGGRWLLRTNEGTASLFDLSKGSLLWKMKAPHSATGIYFFRWAIDPAEENLFVSAHPFSGDDLGPGPQVADIWKLSLKTFEGDLIRRVITPYAYSQWNVALSSTMLVTGLDVYPENWDPQDISSMKRIHCFDIRHDALIFDDYELTLEGDGGLPIPYGIFLVSEFLVVFSEASCSAFDTMKARSATSADPVSPTWVTHFPKPTRFSFDSLGAPIARQHRTDKTKWKVEIMARRARIFQTWIHLDCNIPPNSPPLFKLSILCRTEQDTDVALAPDHSHRVFIWPTNGRRDYSRIALGYFPSSSSASLYVKSNSRLIDFPEFRGISEVYGDGLSGIFCVIGVRKDLSDHGIIRSAIKDPVWRLDARHDHPRNSAMLGTNFQHPRPFLILGVFGIDLTLALDSGHKQRP